MPSVNYYTGIFLMNLLFQFVEENKSSVHWTSSSFNELNVWYGGFLNFTWVEI